MSHVTEWFIFHSMTAVRVLLFWLPLAAVRIVAWYLLSSFASERFLPLYELQIFAIMFIPGLLLIVGYPFVKGRPLALPAPDYTLLKGKFSLQERETDIRRYRQYILAATVTTLMGLVVAAIVLRFFDNRGTDASASIREMWDRHSRLSLFGPYFLSWFATPLVRRLVFGRFASPFYSFRCPLPRHEIVSHKGRPVEKPMRGGGAVPHGAPAGSRWNSIEDEE